MLGGGLRVRLGSGPSEGHTPGPPGPLILLTYTGPRDICRAQGRRMGAWPHRYPVAGANVSN